MRLTKRSRFVSMRRLRPSPRHFRGGGNTGPREEGGGGGGLLGRMRLLFHARGCPTTSTRTAVRAGALRGRRRRNRGRRACGCGAGWHRRRADHRFAELEDRLGEGPGWGPRRSGAGEDRRRLGRPPAGACRRPARTGAHQRARSRPGARGQPAAAGHPDPGAACQRSGPPSPRAHGACRPSDRHLQGRLSGRPRAAAERPRLQRPDDASRLPQQHPAGRRCPRSPGAAAA